MAEDKDPFAGLTFDDKGKKDAFAGLTFDVPEKKKLSEPINGKPEVSTPGSSQVVAPSSESGAKVKDFEQRIANPIDYITNSDGTKSTHKMASAEVNGKQIAYPTIVKVDGKLKELSDKEAQKYALTTGEYKVFANDEQAQEYAEGGYKRGTPLEDYDNWLSKRTQYQWGDGVQTKLATGTEGTPPSDYIVNSDGKKIEKKKVGVYLSDKQTEQLHERNKMESAATVSKFLNQSDDFQRYQQTLSQYNDAVKRGDPSAAQLGWEVERIKNMPFLISTSPEEETGMIKPLGSDVTDQQFQQIPEQLKGVKTIADVAELSKHLPSQYERSQWQYKKLQAEIDDVVKPMRKAANFDVNAKTGLHEYGVSHAFMKGALSLVDKTAMAVQLLSAKDDAERIGILKQRGGMENIAFPEGPDSDLASVAETAGTLAPYFVAPELLGATGAGAVATTIGSSVANGLMMGATGYADNYQRVFNEKLQQGGDDQQALEAAKTAGNVGGGLGVATGAMILPAMGALGAKAGTAALGKELGEWHSLTIPEFLKYTLPKNAIGNLPFPMQTYIDNKVAQSVGVNRKSMEGVGQGLAAAIFIGSMIDGLHYGGAKLTPKIKSVYETAIAKHALPDVVSEIGKQVEQGNITQEEATKITEPIIRIGKALKEMPQNLNPKEEQEILPYVQDIQHLEKQKENTEEAFHPAIDAAIEENNKVIREKMGAPLTEKESKEYENILDKKDATDADGKKTSLLDSEKVKLKHFEKRVDVADKKAEEEKQRKAEEKEIKKQYEVGDVVELNPTTTEQKLIESNAETPKPATDGENLETGNKPNEEPVAPTTETGTTDRNGTEFEDKNGVFKIDNQDTFFHASSRKRNGPLTANEARQFGTGVYFSTNEKLVKEEFGDHVTKVQLHIEKPVYTNTPEWAKVEELALKKHNDKLPKNEDGEFEKPEAIDLADIKPALISEAAKELGYDAIVDKDSDTYDNEIVVLDAKKIHYPDEPVAAVEKTVEEPVATTSDTHLAEGLQNIGKQSESALNLINIAAKRGYIPEQAYNEIGAELSKVKGEGKNKKLRADDVIAKVATIVQKYVEASDNPDFVKELKARKDMALEQNQKVENEKFADRQQQLEKFIPDGDLKEEKIFDEVERITGKVVNGEVPTKEELDFVNENGWLPKGYKFGEKGLEPSTETQQPNAEATNEYKTLTEPITMPDGEPGVKVTIEKPNGEKVELGNMYPEDVESEVAKKVRGYKLADSKGGKTEGSNTPEPETTKQVGDEIAFTHAGQDKTGKVVSVDAKGNYKVEDSKGTKYTVNNEMSAGEKHYEEVAGSKPNTKTGRIPVDPIIGGKPKNLRDIVFDVTKGIKQRLFFAKTSRGAGGTYSPGNSAVKIKFNGDLDNTAHELGHSIDDHFGILSDLLTTPNMPVELELDKFSPYGSKPPKGHPNPRMYKYGEGFAEWLRAYIVNPTAAKSAAPELTKLYESKASAEYKKAVDDFSNDVRTWAGASGRDITLANVEVEPKKETLMGKILSPESNNEFVVSWVDRLAANFTNPLTAFNKAFEYAKDVKGVGDVLPSDDPRILARLLLGVDGKYGEVLQHGMIDGENNLLKDANGNAKNLDWLLEPLDNTDQSTIKKDMEDVIAYMVAERTVELSKKFGRSDILSGIGGGIFKDIDVAQKTLDEFTNGDPNRLTRIQEAADRYREFSDDILKYMVEKGRMSQENYDEIKKNNLQYVAMLRVMETEPNREVESGFGAGSKLGNKSEPIKKIKGSTKTIQNPYISLIDTLHKAMKESDRNDVLRSFRDMLTESRGMYEGDPKRFADIGVIGKEGDKNAITIFVDGKPEHWIFQDDVYKALKGLDSEGYRLPGVMTALPKALRWTVTHFPTFAARNIVRDFQDRIIKSNDNSGIRDLFGDKEHWRELARSGGLNSGYYMRDKASYYGLLEVAMHDMAKDKGILLLDPVRLKHAWEGYTNLLGKSETVNRVAEYRAAFRNAKAKGMDDYNASLYAGYKSRDLMDFALMGHWMKVMNQMVPFSNAGVQGLRKAALSAKENPVGFTARMFAYSVVPGIALWLLNHKDEQTAKEYESMPAYQRDMAFNFKIGSDKWVSIPKPYELSLTGAGIDRAMSAQFYGKKNAFEGYAGSVANSLLPIDQANLTPFPGIVEGVTNYDFFRDKAIVPPYENNVDLALRNTDRASRLGKVLQDVSGIDARKIDHFVKGQFSYFGNAALKTSNLGRKDGDKFGLHDLGFFQNTPAYNSPQVQDLMKYAEQWRLGASKPMKEFKRLASEYFDAKDDADKDKKAEILRDYAVQQLNEWKKENINEQKIKAKEDKDAGIKQKNKGFKFNSKKPTYGF